MPTHSCLAATSAMIGRFSTGCTHSCLRGREKERREERKGLRREWEEGKGGREEERWEKGREKC